MPGGIGPRVNDTVYEAQYLADVNFTTVDSTVWDALPAVNNPVLIAQVRGWWWGRRAGRGRCCSGLPSRVCFQSKPPRSLTSEALCSSLAAALSASFDEGTRRPVEDTHQAAIASQTAFPCCSPVLLQGALDILVPPINAQLIADRIPNSWLARFPRWGHWIQDPVAFTNLVNAFLDAE